MPVEVGEHVVERRRAPPPRASAKAGTHCSVTVAITPSAPRPDRGGGEEQVGRVDVEQRRRRPGRAAAPRTWVARPPSSRPCRACRSRWRRRSSARRCRRGWSSPGRACQSASLSSCSRVPASTVTRPGLAVGAQTMPLSRSGRSCTPSVAPIAVNECPAPIGLTRLPASAAMPTASRSSSTVAGLTGSTSLLTVPAQFVQVVMPTHPRLPVVTDLAALSRATAAFDPPLAALDLAALRANRRPGPPRGWHAGPGGVEVGALPVRARAGPRHAGVRRRDGLLAARGDLAGRPGRARRADGLPHAPTAARSPSSPPIPSRSRRSR